MDNSKKKNVLCVFLSDLRMKKDKGCFYYSSNNSQEYKQEDSFTGIHTNEPIAKYLIRTLAGKNEKLDQIIMICTKKVETSIKKQLIKEQELKNKGKENQASKYECEKAFFDNELKRYDSECTENDTNALHYYELAIVDFIKKEIKNNQMPNLYELESKIGIVNLRENENSFFKVISIGNDPSESDTYQYLSKLVKLLDNKTNLYIDLNGGFRDAAFILLAITRVMSRKGVELKGCYHINMNRDNSISNPMIIKDKQYLFKAFDLISGTDEFFEYGSVDRISEFFKEDNLDQIELQSDFNNERNLTIEIQELMKIISENLRVCRASETWSAFCELRTKIKIVQEYCKSENIKGSKYQVFFSLLDNVEQEYGTLLDDEKENDYLGLIEWCKEKKMLQQALTFYEDLVPLLLVDKEVIYWNKSVITEKMIEKQTRFTKDDNRYTFVNSIDKVFMEFLAKKERNAEIEKKANLLKSLRTGWKSRNFSKEYFEKKSEKFDWLLKFLKDPSYDDIKECLQADDYLERLSIKRAIIIMDERGLDKKSPLSDFIDNEIIMTNLEESALYNLNQVYKEYEDIKVMRNDANHGKNSISCEKVKEKLEDGIKNIKLLISKGGTPHCQLKDV